VYVYDEDEYQQMRLLVTDDGRAGIALEGDGIVSAFAHKNCAHPKAVQSMLSHVTALGGRRLDCFDTVLPNLYAAAPPQALLVGGVVATADADLPHSSPRE